MNEFVESNRALWDEWTEIHEKSSFYDVEGFLRGRDTLNPLEVGELGDVRGKKLLHLQCHFGLDTMSWARRGASVTGVDLSPKAIDLARRLARDTAIDARFICSELFLLREHIDDVFDIVFTSYGVLWWLPDLQPWGAVIAESLTPGGTFYMAEFHPLLQILDENAPELRIAEPYLGTGEPLEFPNLSSYADPEAPVEHPVEYGWAHGLGEVVSALADAGLHIEYLREHPFMYESRELPVVEQNAEGLYVIRDGLPQIPLLYSLLAGKP